MSDSTPTTAEHDAFFAGCDAGRHHWRLMADK